MVNSCDSNELLPGRDGRRSNLQSFEIGRPIVRGVWEQVKLVEHAARVAVSSGLIQVSVRAMRLRPE